MSATLTIWGRTLTVLSIAAVFFTFAYLGHQSESTLNQADTVTPTKYQDGITSKNTTTVHTAETTIQTPAPEIASKNTITYRILCYGDSLTAGVSPPNPVYSPYSKYLQEALDKRLGTSETTEIKYEVQHVGLPGWTTTQFLSIVDQEDGLQYTVQKQAPVHLVVLLAGTNDLPGLLGDRTSQEDNVTQPLAILSNNLMQLHQAAWTAGVPHTIALGIPGSAYQQTMSLAAAHLAQQANQQLDQKALANPQKMTYMPFPFPFVEGGEKWSPDGLHFSPAGYQLLGEKLAPMVQTVLQQPAN